MTYLNFVELHSQMLHTKFQNHRPSGSEEEDFKTFLLFIAMAAILDLDHLYKLSFPLPKDAPQKSLALIGLAVSEKKMFQYYGLIHVYSPGAEADNPLGPKYFLKRKSSVHLLISSKFSAI